MVHLEYAVDYLSWKLVRTRGNAPHGQVLTMKGWIDKEQNQAVKFDETMLWDTDDLEELATLLANRGIKPKDASYTEGKLKATEAHLDDMRKLALGKSYGNKD